MRKTLSRIAAVAVGVALTTVLPVSPASAATSGDCNHATSTRLLTGSVLGDYPNDRLWVDYPTPTRTVVCFQFQSLFLGGVTVVADYATGAVPPRVDVDDDPSICPNAVLNVVDPVPLRLAVGLATNSVCLTVNGSTVSLRFTQGTISPSTLPVFEVWRDGGANWGWIDAAACPAEYAVAVAFGGPDTCMRTNDRIFP